MRLAVTSDLHFDFGGQLTPPEAITAMVVQIARSQPDAVVLAGDTAAGFAAFEAGSAIGGLRPSSHSVDSLLDSDSSALSNLVGCWYCLDKNNRG